MTPIDLVDYTHSKKIPTSFLKQATASKTEIKTWKILAALVNDMVMVMGTTFIISGFLKLSFQTFMVTSSLMKSFNGIPFHAITSNVMPFMFMSYFFFCFFFNRGQTFGMNNMKIRVTMPEQSYRASLLWAAFSSGVLMTFGLSYVWSYRFMQKKNWGKFETHDHLYETLMVVKQFSTVNLVEMTLVPLSQETTEEETYLEAA